MNRKSFNRSSSPIYDVAPPVPQASEIFDDAERLANVVQKVYTLERRLYELRSSGHASGYCPADYHKTCSNNLELVPRKPPWPTIAAFLIKKRIGPIDYIARQFDQYALLARPPLPNELCGPRGWERYTTSKATKPRELTVQLRFCRSHLATEMETGGLLVWSESQTDRSPAVERCLSAMYGETSYPALFIFCVMAELAAKYPSHRDDAHDLMGRFELQAALEYLRFHSDYDEAWGKMIPAGSLQRARRLYQQVLWGLP